MPEFASARRRRKAARVAEIPRWFHSIDLGDGVVTPGQKSPEQLRDEVDHLRLPPLEGLTVLDVGTWDGYFAFEAERRGAKRVVALDHFIWSVNRAQLDVVMEDAARRGVPLPRPDDCPGLWDQSLPGRRGFDLAHAELRSRVEPLVADFMSADLAAIGSHDVVLFLGVLYHVRDPLLALERLRAVTGQLAIIETEANLYEPDAERAALWEFVERDQRAGDYTNWWIPNAQGVVALCCAAGFAQAEVVAPREIPLNGEPCTPLPFRVVVHARP